jgi:SAM-dependent methyltransferase
MFVDKREITIKRRDTSSFGDERTLEIAPDVVADFTALPFPDESFWHVVFDPPHMETLGERSYMALQYGRLEGDWRDMLRRGFDECFRVLKPNGTLNFKWNECEISVQEILALTTAKPLYGNRYGKHYRTHWIAFLKPNTTI